MFGSRVTPLVGRHVVTESGITLDAERRDVIES
jgi:hypothetical protein